MRIAIDVRPLFVYGRRGIGSYLRNILSSLSLIDKKNTYILLKHIEMYGKKLTLPDSSEPELLLRELGDNFKIEETFISRSTGNYNDLVIDVMKFPLHYPIDLFWGPNLMAPIFGEFIKVVTVHDLFVFIFPDYYDDQAKKTCQLGLDCLEFCDHIVAVSEATKKDILRFQRKIDRNRIDVIYNASQESFRMLEEHEKEMFRKENALPEKFILAVNAIEPRKNISFLIDAFARALKTYGIKNSLIIIGANFCIDDQYKQIMESVRLSGVEHAIQFRGYVNEEDMVFYYNLADFYVLPSLYEGFGIPILEAMKCGTPVITSNTSSMPEVADDAALYFDPSDVDELAKAISLFTEDEVLKSSYRQKGLLRCHEFTWDKTASELLTLFEKVYTERKQKE